MKDAEITVVMATYRQTEYLPQAMLSVLGQSEPCKLVVVHAREDKQTDELLTELYSKWQLQGRYQGTTTEIADMWVQRQAGLDLVETPYVCFFDSDDYMMPGWLEKALSIAVGIHLNKKIVSDGRKTYTQFSPPFNKVPIIGPSYQMTDESLRPIQEVELPSFTMGKMLKGCIIPDFSITTAEALRSVGGFFDPDYPIKKTYNFYATWLRMLKNLNCEVELRPDIGFLYRQHKKNLHHKVQSKRNSRRNVEMQRMIARHYFPEVSR